MAWRPLFSLVARRQSEFGIAKNLFVRGNFSVNKFGDRTGDRFLCFQEKFQSRKAGNFSHRVRDADESIEASHLKELNHRNDPEAVIRVFENQPSLHTNPSALSEYVKALVKVDRLEESELLKTLRRGISNSAREEESIGGFSAFRNEGKSIEEDEAVSVKDLQWRAFKILLVGFLMFTATAFIED